MDDVTATSDLKEHRVELESLEQFAEILRQLRPGEAAEMTDDVFELFFPPGIKDDAAKGWVLAFAW